MTDAVGLKGRSYIIGRNLQVLLGCVCSLRCGRCARRERAYHEPRCCYGSAAPLPRRQQEALDGGESCKGKRLKLLALRKR